jgi:nucleoside-triphosphatase THEP1
VQYLKLKGNKNLEEIGRWEIIPGAFDKGKEIFAEEDVQEKDIVIIDETGKLETRGGGWHDEVKGLLLKRKGILILSVRKRFISEVLGSFGINDAHITDVTHERAFEKLLEEIRGLK